MVQSQLNFRERPSPATLFTYGSQSYQIYERLLMGPLTNAEIVRGIGAFNSTGRISDIRKALKPYLMDIEATRVKRGLYSYELKG